jgi:hypothetical protein
MAKFGEAEEMMRYSGVSNEQDLKKPHIDQFVIHHSGHEPLNSKFVGSGTSGKRMKLILINIQEKHNGYAPRDRSRDANYSCNNGWTSRYSHQRPETGYTPSLLRARSDRRINYWKIVNPNIKLVAFTTIILVSEPFGIGCSPG